MKKIEHSNFIRLIGVWKTIGTVKTGKDTIALIGIDTYEFILDGHFILHKADVKMGHERSETFEIIKPDNAFDKATMHYFNTKGEEGIMHSSLINNAFEMEGNSLKFIGTINKENTKIIGKWYTKLENDTWTDFIDLILEK